MSVRFKRSYRDRKDAVAKRKKVILKVILLIFTLQIVFTVFLSTIKLNSISMEPSLEKGSAVVYSPISYGSKAAEFIGKRSTKISPERGHLVVLTPPYKSEQKGFVIFIGNVIKFLSFGKININYWGSSNWQNQYLIKRVIALPGDSIKMDDFTALIKTADSEFFLNEFEIIDREYDTNLGELPLGWHDSLPFTGNMDPLTLGENEYFVLGDNRTQSSDSSSWGVLKRENIIGKVLMTYWPLNKFKTY